MTIVGRLTHDAAVRQLKQERQVVSFSIAVNDSYKKNGERIRLTTFYNCSYWVSGGLAGKLKKGALVELNGRIYVTAYLNKNGAAKASLNCHVNSIKVHEWPKEAAPAGPPAEEDSLNNTEETPF